METRHVRFLSFGRFLVAICISLFVGAGLNASAEETAYPGTVGTSLDPYVNEEYPYDDPAYDPYWDGGSTHGTTLPSGEEIYPDEYYYEEEFPGGEHEDEFYHDEEWKEEEWEDKEWEEWHPEDDPCMHAEIKCKERTEGHEPEEEAWFDCMMTEYPECMSATGAPWHEQDEEWTDEEWQKFNESDDMDVEWEEWEDKSWEQEPWDEEPRDGTEGHEDPWHDETEDYYGEFPEDGVLTFPEPEWSEEDKMAEEWMHRLHEEMEQFPEEKLACIHQLIEEKMHRCGTAPVPACVAKTLRHALERAGECDLMNVREWEQMPHEYKPEHMHRPPPPPPMHDGPGQVGEVFGRAVGMLLEMSQHVDDPEKKQMILEAYNWFSEVGGKIVAGGDAGAYIPEARERLHAVMSALGGPGMDHGGGYDEHAGDDFVPAHAFEEMQHMLSRIEEMISKIPEAFAMMAEMGHPVDGWEEHYDAIKEKFDMMHGICKDAVSSQDHEQLRTCFDGLHDLMEERMRKLEDHVEKVKKVPREVMDEVGRRMGFDDEEEHDWEEEEHEWEDEENYKMERFMQGCMERGHSPEDCMENAIDLFEDDGDMPPQGIAPASDWHFVPHQPRDSNYDYARPQRQLMPGAPPSFGPPHEFPEHEPGDEFYDEEIYPDEFYFDEDFDGDLEYDEFFEDDGSIQ